MTARAGRGTNSVSSLRGLLLLEEGQYFLRFIFIELNNKKQDVDAGIRQEGIRQDNSTRIERGGPGASRVTWKGERQVCKWLTRQECILTRPGIVDPESDRCCASSHLKNIFSKDPLMTGRLCFVSLYKSFI